MKKIDYAFIVHSRGRSDLPRKFPILKYVPYRIFDFITLTLPPFIVSKISGLVDSSSTDLHGVVIGIPMTAHQLLERRDIALKKILQAVRLAKKRGAKYIGLGAMTASLSKGGRDIIEHISDIHVTTGRTYTTKNITDYIEYCVQRSSLDKTKIKIGIIGAAGGIGSNVAISLARKQYRKFILVDLERKLDHLTKRIDVLEQHAKDLEISVSHKISALNGCTVIVAATSSPEIVLKSEDVDSGTIIINDAQPSDISPEIIKNRLDVLVIEGGVLHTPNINCHFNFGLCHKNDVFSCLAETLLLSSTRSIGHHSIDDFDPELYNELSVTAKELGFTRCMQNELGLIDEKRLSDFGKILKRVGYN